MVEINLLPWRLYAHQKYKKQLYLASSGAALFSILFICFLHLMLVHLIKNEKIRINDYLQKLAALSSQSQRIKKQDQEGGQYQMALQVLNHARANQAVTLEFFNKIMTQTPDEIVFSTISREESKIVITGKSQTMPALTQFITHFPKAQLLEINNVSDTTQIKFKFQVIQDEIV